MNQFDSEISRSEYNDCTVRALTWVSGLPYEIVHKCLKKHGREDRRGFAWRRPIHSIGADLGLKFRQVKRCGSLAKLARLFPQGRLAVEVRGHALALIDGEFKGASRLTRHVKVAWLVTPIK